VGADAPTSPLSAALGFCLAEGSLPRAIKHLAGEGCCSRTPAFRCARLLSCRRLATAGNEAPGRWGLPPLHPRFPLRSACLAEGSLWRATKRMPSFARVVAQSYRDHMRITVITRHFPTSEIFGVLLRKSKANKPKKYTAGCLRAGSTRHFFFICVRAPVFYMLQKLK
jgi:hypothetical protein